MKRLIAMLAVLATVGTIPAKGQAQWDESQSESGATEYRLRNDEGAVIILSCHIQGVVVGFEFPEPLDNPTRATVRSIPGEQQNIAVSPLSDRVVSVTGRGTVLTLRLLRDAARLFVRMAGESATFSTSGSGHIVEGCLARQEALPSG